MAFRSGNPALNSKTFTDFGGRTTWGVGTVDGASVMTLEGTVHRTGILLLVLGAAATFTWRRFFFEGVEAVYPWMIAGFLGGLVLAIVTVVKKQWAPWTAPMYAAFEGLALGGISAMFESMYPQIVIQAVALTFGTMLALLAAYATRIIKPTENFKLGVAAATGGIFLVYLVTWVLGMFGASIPYIHGAGTVGIAFSAFVVVIAALNLVLDFDFIEEGAQGGAPKYMEWYGAFGLVVTLVWLYIEILHLLSKLRSR